MSCGSHHEMPCSDVLLVIMQFVDGELSGAVTEEITVHIEQCSPCGDEYRVIRTMKARVLNANPGPMCPPGLRDRLMSMVHIEIEFNEGADVTRDVEIRPENH